MNEEMMTAGTGGFSNSPAATGPNAGFDPVMKFRKKIKKKKAVKESTTCPRDSQRPSRLFQYKVNVPEVGETIVYANSPAELRMKLRMAIMPKYRSGINIERIMPGNAGKFFMDKRMKHMRNVSEAQDTPIKNQMNQQKIQNMKKKVMLKKQELQKQLQLKTQQLKKKARVGAELDATR